MRTERAARQAIVAEARSWIGTPYLHQGRVKGAGVDCAMLLLEVYERVGLIPHLALAEVVVDPAGQIAKYPPDWMLHRDEERYLEIVERFARKLPRGESVAPLDGDIALYRWGRTISHGAIVDRWPRIIHAYSRSGWVEYGEGDRGEVGGPGLDGKPRLAGFWSLWPSGEAVLKGEY
jgi:cell wall-associated NlpC family hydrolase